MNIRSRRLGAFLMGASMALAACGGSSDDTASDATTSTTAATTEAVESEETTTTEAMEEEEVVGGYPVVLSTSTGDVTISAQPERIVSLSPSATEMLFAIGAGDQVVAADSFSNYPPEAPTTDLSAFTPNFEAISAFEPDLVITSFDSENALQTAFAALDVPVLVQGTAFTIDDTYAQVAELGVVTDQIDDAAAVNAEIRERVDAAIAQATGRSGEPVKVYHELDDTFFSVSSSSFIGDLYAKMGFENIADPADPDGFGFPQLTPEFLIEANPDLIVITDQVGYTPNDVAARPGWDVIAAVENANVVLLDADIASRWGPRVADLAESLADLSTPATTG